MTAQTPLAAVGFPVLLRFLGEPQEVSFGHPVLPFRASPCLNTYVHRPRDSSLALVRPTPARLHLLTQAGPMDTPPRPNQPQLFTMGRIRICSSASSPPPTASRRAGLLNSGTSGSRERPAILPPSLLASWLHPGVRAGMEGHHPHWVRQGCESPARTLHEKTQTVHPSVHP